MIAKNCRNCGRIHHGGENYCKWCCQRALSEYRNSKKGLKRTSLDHILKDSNINPLEHTPIIPGAPMTIDTQNFHWLSLEHLARHSFKLAQMAPPDIDAIIGVARSGLTPANIISTVLHKPILAIRQTLHDIVPVGNGWRLGGHSHISINEKSKVLVVDDTVMTGNSTAHITHIVKKQFPNAVFSAVYVNPAARVKPNFWVADLPWPHLLEWNIFNSILSHNMALDFDGVLCDDCPPGSDDDGPRYEKFIKTARPKYLPRKVPVALVVTARIEKYRKLTEEWLAKHGVVVRNLVMHPAKTLHERNQCDIAAYKAEHYKKWLEIYKPRPKPAMFVESDHNQAKRIALLSGKLTVCPTTMAVFGSP